jgi:demethylmenaquinone methyltransferase/2-methoxy-6-polyprenyl-1,4-benzoquinol methylase
LVHVTGERNRFAQQLFTPLPGRYDLLAEFLSFGQNGRWRAALIDHLAAADPDRVLDVATGTAGVAIQLAAQTTGSIVGADLTLAMLRQGRHRLAASGLVERIPLAAGRAEELPFADASFDAVAFTYLLRYVDDPAATLCELSRVVKPGGMMASLDFLAPPQRFWRAWWWIYTRGVLPVAGLIAGGRPWYRVGRFLGPNISEHYRRFPVQSIVDAWGRAGFDDVQVRTMSCGGGLVMSGVRRP